MSDMAFYVNEFSCLEFFSPGTPVFLPLQNQHISDIRNVKKNTFYSLVNE